jgi:hypothetical protein
MSLNVTLDPSARLPQTRIQSGMSIETALDTFAALCNQSDTLFITERWVAPRIERLRMLLTDPLSAEQADVFNETIGQRVRLDEMIDWLASRTSWDDYLRVKVADAARDAVEKQERRDALKRILLVIADAPFDDDHLSPNDELALRELNGAVPPPLGPLGGAAAISGLFGIAAGPLGSIQGEATLDWGPEAVKDIDRLDRKAAGHIKECVSRFVGTGVGDVGRVKYTSHGRSENHELALRVREWRVFFEQRLGTIRIKRVLSRGNAYR